MPEKAEISTKDVAITTKGKSSEELRSQIARNPALCEYYVELRRGLNSLGFVADLINSDQVDLKEKMSTKALRALGSAASLVPVFGSAAQAVLAGATLISRQVDVAKTAANFGEVIKMNPTCDTSEWNAFTREFATEIVANLAKQMEIERAAAGKPDDLTDKFRKAFALGKKGSDVKALAKRDCAEIAARIFSGKLEINNPEGIEDKETRAGIITQLASAIERPLPHTHTSSSEVTRLSPERAGHAAAAA